MLDTAVFVVQKLLGGSQLLFSATMLILDSSPIDAQVDTSEQFS